MLPDKLNIIVNNLTSYYQSIVGISYYKTDVHVVEIKKTFREIVIINSKCYENSENVFEQINADFNLKDKKITVNIYLSSGSYKLLEIPQMPKVEIETWLNDNSSEFLPTGLSINDILLTYKIVRANDNLLLLLGILNNEEVNDLINKIKNVGGILSNVSPGFLNSVRFDQIEKDETAIHNYYIEHEDYHELAIFENNSLLYYNQVLQAFQSENKVDSIKNLFSSDLQILNTEITDENLNTINLEGEINNEFSLEKEYLTAYVLALSELEKTDTFNLLPAEAFLDSEIITWKQTFLKVSLVAGVSIFVAYLFAFLLVFFIGTMQQGIEDNRAVLASQLSQINSLQSQKSTLENDLRAARQVKQYKSNSSILLDMFSFHIPKNCWLTEVIYNDESEKAFNTFLKGMSKDESKINDFLKNLESDKNLKSVKLDYINKLSRDEMYRDWKIRSSLYLEYQISVEY